MTVGLICGLQPEARALGALKDHPDLKVGVSGARPEEATRLAAAMIGSGAKALVSWGIAGGLDPDLPSGALIVPGAVILADGERIDLFDLPHADDGAAPLLAGSDTVVATPEAKLVIRSRTGAAAVDMETHRVASVARDAGLPCFAIRAISDPAERTMPPGTENAVDEAGNPLILPVIAGLIRRPASLGALLAAKRDFDTALATLSTLGPGLLGSFIERVQTDVRRTR